MPILPFSYFPLLHSPVHLSGPSLLQPMSRIRQREIHARRKRQAKLLKLRTQYASTTGVAREQILSKVRRVSPAMTEEQFTASAKGKK